MGFPHSRNSLENAGYRFDTMDVCRGVCCKEEIAWFWTRKGKRIPVNADGTAHWATCVDAAQFQTPRRRYTHTAKSKD